MTYAIAHIVDGLGHSTNIFGCNMNEYRNMTYRIHFCLWNNFTDGTPYYSMNTVQNFSNSAAYELKAFLYLPVSGYVVTAIPDLILSALSTLCYKEYKNREKANFRI